jgi:glutathione S-transferase
MAFSGQGFSMIIVHHLNNSRSQRILWLLEELGLDYEIKKYQRDAKTMLAPPELRAVHPLGKSPVISDGATVVAESGAIAEYLVERHGVSAAGSAGGNSVAAALAPAQGTPERLHYTYFLHYAEGSLMPPLLLKLVFDRVASAPAPFFVRPIARGIAAKVIKTFVQPNLDTHLGFLEAELGKRTWFAGSQFSAADIQMSFPLEAAASRGGLDGRYPNLVGFLERIHARPAYRRALERGGKYDFVK